MSTRRERIGQFNHGAQYITASNPAFEKLLAKAVLEGLVEEWQARIGVLAENGLKPASPGTVRYVGVPGMNSLCHHMAKSIPDVRFNWQVSALEHSGASWKIRNQDGDELTADAVLLTAPPEQAKVLLPHHGLESRLNSVHMQPCWAVMAVLDRPLFKDFQAAFVNTGPLSWVAEQPGTATASSAWILHANPEWSQQHLEQDPDWISSELLLEAGKLADTTDLQVIWSKAHRWRFCRAAEPLQAGCLEFPDSQLVLAGDWCHGSRAEGAFLSGMAASEAVKSMLATSRLNRAAASE